MFSPFGGAAWTCCGCPPGVFSRVTSAPNETSQSSVERAELPLTMFPPQAETGVGVEAAGKRSAAPPAAWAATLKECGRGQLSMHLPSCCLGRDTDVGGGGGSSCSVITPKVCGGFQGLLGTLRTQSGRSCQKKTFLSRGHNREMTKCERKNVQ